MAQTIDPAVQKRIDRIKQLMAKEKRTSAENDELKKLLDEQMAWERKNPDQAATMKAAADIAAKSPEQLKAEYDTFVEDAKKKGLKGGVSPETEAAAKAAGDAARAKALSEGKTPAQANAYGLSAYMDYLTNAATAPKAAPAAKPVDAVSMASPTAPAPAQPAPAPAQAPAQAPAPVQAPATPAPQEPDQRGYGDRTREFEEAEANRQEPAPTTPSAPAEEPKKSEKKKFGQIAGELAKKYGVPVLEILQAVGYQRGNINKPTLLDQKYEEQMKQEERDYQKRLEDERAAREEALYQKRITEQRDWEAKQSELARIAEKEARGEELSMQEKIAKMELAARQAAARQSATPAPIIPD